MGATREQLEMLKKYTRIKGDGAAKLELEEALKDQLFRDAIKSLADLKLDEQKRHLDGKEESRETVGA